MSDLAKGNHWRSIIDTCIASEMPIKQWCHLNNVSLSQYHYWKRKLSVTKSTNPDKTTEWAPLIVECNPAMNVSCTPIILQAASYKIELREGFNTDMLSDVLKVIGSLC